MREYTFKVKAINVLPFGRINEYIAQMTEDQKKRTGIRHGQGIFDDSTIKIFTTREALAKTIRKEERNAPCSKWKPVVKLTDGRSQAIQNIDAALNTGIILKQPPQ